MKIIMLLNTAIYGNICKLKFTRRNSIRLPEQFIWQKKTFQSDKWIYLRGHQTGWSTHQ